MLDKESVKSSIEDGFDLSLTLDSTLPLCVLNRILAVLVTHTVLRNLSMKEDVPKINSELFGNGSNYLAADLSKDAKVEILFA